jgi:hypothetical protein
MRGMAHAKLSSGKEFACVLEVARFRGIGPRTDRNGRDKHKDPKLIETLEAENLELRNLAIQLAFDIQNLRRTSGVRKQARSCGTETSVSRGGDAQVGV